MSTTQVANAGSAGFQREVDLLVFGAGAGGMCAALAGAIHDLEVLVCEKSDQIGGTAATSAGTIWIPGSRKSREAGFDDSADATRRYLDRLVADPREGAALREVYLFEGPRVVDWFEEHSDLQFVPFGVHPDYLAEEGAAISGRALVPREFDGRLLGAAFADVRAPIPEFKVFGGMMVGKADIPRLVGRFRSAGNFFYAARLFARYLFDRRRHARGTRLVMGNAFVARLYHSLRKRGVAVQRRTALVELVQQQGEVVGAVIDADSIRERVRARRGVVLATGGYARNAELRRAFMPAPTPADSMAVPSNQGDGIMAAARAGARTSGEHHGSGAFWTPASRTGSGRCAGLYPHLAMDRAKPGLVAVNAAGERFVNEGVSYHHFVEAMFESNRTVPMIPAWLVCETDFVHKYGLGTIHPGTRSLLGYERNGYLVLADTLDALAQRIGADPTGLRCTVERNNRFAETGIDEDFCKGTIALNRFNGDPPAVRPTRASGRSRQEPTARRLCGQPRSAAALAWRPTPMDACSTNQAGRSSGCMRAATTWARSCAAPIPAPGTTLGPAMVFGYLAATHAAQR